MRVATDQQVRQVEPGATVEVVVDVVNTGDLIDGVTARVIGLPEAEVAVEPQLLPLFPDATGQLRVSITVPTTQPAGTHPVTVEVISHGAGAPTQHLDLDLSVSARPAARLVRSPEVVRARRAGRFLIAVENTGNVALDATLGSVLEDSRTATRFTPETLRVEPGTSTPVLLVVRGPRMLTGSEVERPVRVVLTGRRAYSIPAMGEADQGPDVEDEVALRLRQRPTLSRGLLTALVLLTIIGLWAAAFLLGLTQVLAGDPVTKTAPASFFTTADDPSAADATVGGEGAEAAAATGGAAAAAPAGAMSKTGLLDPGVGGTIGGTVTAASSQQPVGRILVQAYRTGRDGPVLVSQAASQADGTYSLAGLFPTSYTLKFSADGFTPVWYPAAPSRRGATEVSVAAQGSTQGIDAVVAGLPAQVSGSVDPGSALTPPATTVVARVAGGTTQGAAPVATTPGAEAPPAAGTVVARTTTGGDGSYALPGLPAPATYELSFTSPGYAATKVLTTVNGGEQRLQPSVVLSAGGGQISGTVTDGGGPIGNVTVTTESGGEQVSVVTPTVGAVGAFTLGDLPTPGTYVLTFTADGHGSSTEIVDLAAGESRTDLAVRLAQGTGSVSGRVTGPGGTKLGGVQVWVGGSSTGTTGTTDPTTGSADPSGAAGTTGTTGSTGSTSPSGIPATTTLTQGLVGTFSVNGLRAPGEYTLTFTLDGYAPETVPVSLTADGPAPTVKVTMHSQLGTVTGTVTGPDGRRYDGATITASNGNRTWTTTSGAPGTALTQGGYRLAGLPAGTYSVTVTAAGLTQQTAMVTVTEGGDVTQALRLGS